YDTISNYTTTESLIPGLSSSMPFYSEEEPII
ncbi:unnamed protein product, partial [Rotaria magnacalcarata]